MNYIESLAKYNLSIWLTEFACDHTKTMQEQISYMKQAIPKLEQNDLVFRYSWFNSRDTHSSSLLIDNDTKSQLSAVGMQYVTY